MWSKSYPLGKWMLKWILKAVVDHCKWVSRGMHELQPLSWGDSGTGLWGQWTYPTVTGQCFCFSWLHGVPQCFYSLATAVQHPLPQSLLHLHLHLLLQQYRGLNAHGREGSCTQKWTWGQGRVYIDTTRDNWLHYPLFVFAPAQAYWKVAFSRILV